MSDGSAFVVIAGLVATVILGIVFAITYDARQGKQNEIDVVKTCINGGGSWEMQQLDKEYYPEHVCIRK